MMSVLPPPTRRDSPMSLERIAPSNAYSTQNGSAHSAAHSAAAAAAHSASAAAAAAERRGGSPEDDTEMQSADDDHLHPESSAASTHSERSMATTVAAATPTPPGPAMISPANPPADGTKKTSPGSAATLAPPTTTSSRLTTSPRASPSPSAKPPRPHVSTARNSPAEGQPTSSSAPAGGPSANPSTAGTESAAEKANGTGNGQLPSPPSPTPKQHGATGIAPTLATSITTPVAAPSNVKAGLVSLNDASPSSAAASLTLRSSAVSSTASAPAPPPSSSSLQQLPAPQPFPPMQRQLDQMRTSTAAAPTRSQQPPRYPTLDLAHQRIAELEDENRRLRYDLERAAAARAPAQPTALGEVFAALADYETDVAALEGGAREARERFRRIVAQVVNGTRDGREGQRVLSSAMIPTATAAAAAAAGASDREWRTSPTDSRHLPHPHAHGLHRAQSSPVFPPQQPASASHYADRGIPPPPASGRHYDHQHGGYYGSSRPSPRPAPQSVINLAGASSTQPHHSHQRSGSSAALGGFEAIRERKEHLNAYARDHPPHALLFNPQSGDKRRRAPSFGAETASGEKRLKTTREGDWVKGGSSPRIKDDGESRANGDDFPSPRRLPRVPGWPIHKETGRGGGGGGTATGSAEGGDEIEVEDAVGSPDSDLAEAAGLPPASATSSARRGDDVDDDLLGLVGERPTARTRRESTATRTGRGEETDGDLDEMILETAGAASGSERPQRRDPYASDNRWYESREYAASRHDRDGNIKTHAHHRSGSSHSPVAAYSPAAHPQQGADRDRGYIFRNLHPGGMESVSQQRGSASFPHPASTGEGNGHSSSRHPMYPPGQEPASSTNGGSRVNPHFLPPQVGPPQPKKIYHSSKSVVLPPGGSMSNATGSAAGGNASVGPGGEGIRGPGPGPPNGQPVRRCKSCGEPGRYKDGRCVEKWGPGPFGPGTVCDRCRKKMKRVEKRSGMEAAAAAQSGLASSGASVHYVHGQPYPRVDRPPERRGSFTMSQQEEYSQSTVTLDDPQSQAYEGRPRSFYSQEAYHGEHRSDRSHPNMLPPPHRQPLARRESTQSGSSNEAHPSDRDRRSGLPFRHDAPLTSGGASSAGGEYNTVLPPRRQRHDGDSYREELEHERDRRSEPDARDSSRRSSKEDEDGDADGDAEMDELEDDDLGRNKVKKEDA